MSFFAQTLTGSFEERNEFECLINRLLSLVKPQAFNQPQLFATTYNTMGTKEIDMHSWLAGPVSIWGNVSHTITHLTIQHQDKGLSFFILSGKCCQVPRLRTSPYCGDTSIENPLGLQFERRTGPFINERVKHSNVRKIYFDKNVIAVCKKSIPLLHHY